MATRIEMIIEVLKLSHGKVLTSKEIANEILRLFSPEMEEKKNQSWNGK